MGIPKFFSSLSKKYPPIVDRYVQRKQSDGFDNLYLDMNDIIHICCHSENGPLPISEEEKFEGMSKFIDTLMGIVRPKKMLFIAMEGVTPFAKNNNRRQKKFLNYKEDRLIQFLFLLEEHPQTATVHFYIKFPGDGKAWVWFEQLLMRP
ncbi:5'-3' exoribonuclease 2 homolog [Saccoglossus kowalevskii]